MLSDNTNEPFFGPQWPIYPQIDQLIHISSGPDGNRVYQGFVVQLSSVSPPTYRDRESCYVMEVNNLSLGIGYVLCRLVGVYGGDSQGIGSKPLYATTCCPTGSSSSSGK